MTKIVINKCYGGFGLSPEALLELYKRAGTGEFISSTPIERYFGAGVTDEADKLHRIQEAKQKWLDYLANPPEARARTFHIHVLTPDLKHVLYDRALPRDNADLVALLEDPAWGTQKVSGQYAALEVVEVPDGTDWEIVEYDGMEHIAEKHRTWG